jgi:hypothetical protein
MWLAVKIETSIQREIALTGRDPEIIIMHPNTYKALVKEAWDHVFYPQLSPPSQDEPMKYRGIRILRSKDLKETEVRVY